MLKLSGKRVISALVAVVLAIGISMLFAIGLERFFAQQGVSDSWPVAISSASSIVLVVVTTVYVIFTGHLVRLQSEANTRLVRQESNSVVRKVMESLPSAQTRATVLLTRFPLSKSTPSEIVNDFPYRDLNESANFLRGMALQLPLELVEETMEAVIKLNWAVISCQTIENLVLSEAVGNAEEEVQEYKNAESHAEKKNASNSGAEHVTWDKVRTLFYSRDIFRARFAVQDNPMPEWDDVESGRFVKEARDFLVMLEQKYLKWLS